MYERHNEYGHRIGLSTNQRFCGPMCWSYTIINSLGSGFMGRWVRTHTFMCQSLKEPSGHVGSSQPVVDKHLGSSKSSAE